MMDLQFSIVNQRLRCMADDVYIEGSQRYLHAHFSISEDWVDHVITVFFQHVEDQTPTAVVLPDNLECEIPSSVLRSGSVYIWARGDLAPSIITTNQVTMTVYSTGEVNPDPGVGQDIYSQILSLTQQAQQSAQAAASDALQAAAHAQVVDEFMTAVETVKVDVKALPPDSPPTGSGSMSIEDGLHIVIGVPVSAGSGTGGGNVNSVNGKTGDVILNAQDVGAIPDTAVATDSEVREVLSEIFN